jgi:sorting nexin-8
VKQLLQGADVPDLYIDLFDSLEKQGSGISLAEVNSVLAASGLGADVKGRITALVLPAGMEGASRDGVGRNEFNVFLALIGLAQEGEELGLDAVDDRRRSMCSHSRKNRIQQN